MKKWRLLTLLFTIVMTFAILAGCQNGTESTSTKETGEGTSEDKKSKDDFGTVTVGMDGTHAPYCSLNEDTNELEGFEVDMMKEISERTGLEIETEVASWEGIFGMLDSRQLTTIACSVEPNKEREEKYDFSDPYIEIGKKFAVAKGQGESTVEIKDLDGMKIGCRTGGNAVEQLEEVMKENEIEFEIVPYEGGGMEYDLSLGRIDAFYAPEISIQSSIDSGEFEIEMASIPEIYPSTCAYPFSKDGDDTEELILLFNKAIEEMNEDGTLKKISEKWFNLDASSN